MHNKVPKLMDCIRHDARSELFIVEGDSAARTINQVRDESFQAILPMQGKPMNANKTTQKNIRKNIQFAALIDSLGIDFDNEGQPTGSPDNLKFQNIILLFDPDADGIHARTLMLFFFHRWLRSVLDAGRIFDTYAPQWVITGQGLADPVFATTPDYLKKMRIYLSENGVTEIRSRRFRGLGNVDTEILKKQCVDPQTRHLFPLTSEHVDNALAAFELTRGD